MSEAQITVLVSGAITIAAVWLSVFGIIEEEKKIKNATILTLLALALMSFALVVMLVDRDSEPNKSPRYEKLENVYQLKE
jgi:hypothetical protein